MEDAIADLKQTIDTLRNEVVRLSDQEEIRKLQYQYGYYLDKCLYKEVAELFSDSPETYVQFLGGRYLTKEGVRRLYVGRFASAFAAGRNGPVHGFLLDHPQMQGVVDVDYSCSSDGPTRTGARAKGRFRSLMQAGVHISQAEKHPRGFCQWFEGGIYENEYIKDEDGQWRFLHLRYFPFWHGDVEHGWGYKVSGFVPFPTKTFPSDPNGPDMVVEPDQRMLWPDTRVVPFHYDHPITKQPVKDEDMQAPAFGEDAASSLPALTL
ncbi:SnoaL-like domain-containing protein [Ilyonectria destructans]|nr:SnoaL-like domain-containing protein [Ilyonectria destructans]